MVAFFVFLKEHMDFSCVCLGLTIVWNNFNAV
jgi:hypothetical protein